MLTRKPTIKFDCQQIDELIISLQNQKYSADCPEAQVLATSDSLPFYFSNIHKYISPHNLLFLKRYQTLNDGLYILLKGQISFMFNSTSSQRGEVLSKNKSVPNKTYSGTSLIFSNLSVFQCSLKNCTAVEQSHLLKIEEQQAIASKFYQLFNRRRDIYENHYLTSDHQGWNNSDEFDGVFSVDLKIHSNFMFKKFTFRQTVALKSVGIIAEGRAKKKGKERSHQIQKYGVLLPHVAYQVTSANLEIMQIKNNETLVMKITQKDKTKDKENKGHSLYSKELPTLKRKRSNNRDKMTRSMVGLDTIYSRKEKAKREKELTKISKESQNFTIISSYLCKKNLALIKKQSFTDKNKFRKEDRCKNPLILFNIVNQKSRLAMPNFPNASITPSYERVEPEKTRKKKTTSELKGVTSQNLLRKLKVPLKNYQKMLRRRLAEQKSSMPRGDQKAKSLFTLTADKQKFQVWGQDQFERYQNP